MPFPNLTMNRYVEERAKATGAEYCLMYQCLRKDARGVLDVNLSFASAGEVGIDEFHSWQLDAYMFPLTRGERAAININSFEAAKKLYDQTVPKTVGLLINPDANAQLGSPIRRQDDGSSGLVAVGTEDKALVWQPGRISIGAFDNRAEVTPVYHQRFRAGWPLGSAVRTSDNKVRTRMGVEFQVPFGPLMTETVFVCMLVIPADIDDNAWDALEKYINARDDDWESMKWMTPQIDKVSGQESIYPATADDFWRTMQVYATTGARQWKQYALDYFGDFSWHIDRQPTTEFQPPAGEAPAG